MFTGVCWIRGGGGGGGIKEYIYLYIRICCWLFFGFLEGVWGERKSMGWKVRVLVLKILLIVYV